MSHQREDMPAEHGTETEETTPEPPAVPNNLTFMSLMGTKKGAVPALKSRRLRRLRSDWLTAARWRRSEHQRKFTDYRLQHYASRKQGGKRHHCLHAGYACRDDSDHARGKSPSRGSGLWQGPLAKAKPRRASCQIATKTINTMTYRSAHLTWSPPSPTSNTTPSLPGTGYSLGTSLAIENFVALVRGNQDVTTLALLSKTLNVRAENDSGMSLSSSTTSRISTTKEMVALQRC